MANIVGLDLNIDQDYLAEAVMQTGLHKSSGKGLCPMNLHGLLWSGDFWKNENKR